MMSYILRENDTAWGTIPPQTEMTEEPIGDPWDGATWLLVPMSSKMSQTPTSTL